MNILRTDRKIQILSALVYFPGIYPNFSCPFSPDGVFFPHLPRCWAGEERPPATMPHYGRSGGLNFSGRADPGGGVMADFYGRKRAYTVAGIRRLPCFRCGALSSYSTWQVCANDRRHVPICVRCDLAMNRMALKFMRIGKESIARMMKRYEKEVAKSL